MSENFVPYENVDDLYTYDEWVYRYVPKQLRKKYKKPKI